MSSKKKAIREEFRAAVFKRDGYKCRYCDGTENLDAHHITDRNELPSGGYVVENGITLCPLHHEQAEEWHSSKGTSFYPHMKPEDLYKKIFSSHERALKAAAEKSEAT